MSKVVTKGESLKKRRIMANLIIAAQLYTVRELLKDKSPEEIRSVLKAIKDMGYEAVQISGVGPITRELAETYQEICKELELDICATHVGLEQLLEDLDQVIACHQLWNCQYVGIGSMPEVYRNEEGALSFISICNEIGDKLSAAGLQLIYHNHRFEFQRYQGKTIMDSLFENFNETVGFEIDTYWIQAGGMSPEEWIRKVKGRMAVVHFKDMRIHEDQQEFAEVGYGNLNWQEIIKACTDTGVIYGAVEQDSFYKDPLESLKMSREFLKQVFML